MTGRDIINIRTRLSNKSYYAVKNNVLYKEKLKLFIQNNSFHASAAKLYAALSESTIAKGILSNFTMVANHHIRPR